MWFTDLYLNAVGQEYCSSCVCQPFATQAKLKGPMAAHYKYSRNNWYVDKGASGVLTLPRTSAVEVKGASLSKRCL